MKTGEALQIGGGNIGRALVGEVMHDAGLHVTFADVNEQLITDFNNEGGYPVPVSYTHLVYKRQLHFLQLLKQAKQME